MESMVVCHWKNIPFLVWWCTQNKDYNTYGFGWGCINICLLSQTHRVYSLLNNNEYKCRWVSTLQGLLHPCRNNNRLVTSGSLSLHLLVCKSYLVMAFLRFSFFYAIIFVYQKALVKCVHLAFCLNVFCWQLKCNSQVAWEQLNVYLLSQSLLRCSLVQCLHSLKLLKNLSGFIALP